LRVVLDTCILKLATFPGENNASALIFELARAGLIEAWEIVGTGALKLRSGVSGVAEVVRMSVAVDKRRKGIGRMILRELLGTAERLVCKRSFSRQQKPGTT
jgi:GNAT superfamily N-acetyltransferase